MEMMATEQAHPNWKYATKILASVLPGSSSFDPEDIPGLYPGGWDLFDVEGRDPEVISSALLAKVQSSMSGPLIVVTFASYLTIMGPFFVNTDDLADLIAELPELTDEPFVSGDVIIVAPDVGLVTVVHHNGLIATLSGNKIK